MGKRIMGGEMKHIVSFSGGKDSTAMLLMMIERNMPIDEIVFCDTGMEFPFLYDHIKKVASQLNRDITTLKPDNSFEWFLSKYKKKSGKYKDIDGLGWPGFLFRWCTGNLKTKIFDRYIKNKDAIVYIGIANDEKKRLERKHHRGNYYTLKYPLIDFGMSEKDCLNYCYDKNYHWGGLYQKFRRVSCWCCPLQRIGELRTLYNEFPDLWVELQRLDKLSYRKFRSDYSVDELTERFRNEKCQFGLFKKKELMKENKRGEE